MTTTTRSSAFNFGISDATNHRAFYDTLFKLRDVALDDLNRRFQAFLLRNNPTGTGGLGDSPEAQAAQAVQDAVETTLHSRGKYPFPFACGSLDGSHMKVEIADDLREPFISRKKVSGSSSWL
jgi:hypothetical protein